MWPATPNRQHSGRHCLPRWALDGSTRQTPRPDAGPPRLAVRGAGWIAGADAAAVVGTKRRVEPRLDEPARQAERAAWRHFVRGASALVELRLISSDQSSNEE